MAIVSLLELKKEWLPQLYDYDHLLDCTLYNMSIKPTTVGREWDNKGKLINEGKSGFKWDASFNIRHNNTTVHLHSDDNDKQLKRFKKKLIALRDGIKEFVKESERRINSPSNDHPVLLKREWLNDLNEDTPYTGYFFYKIHPNGGGKFFIADCTRSINLWLELSFFPDDPVINEVSLKQAKNSREYLLGIAVHLDRAIEAIKRLNGRHRNGELINMLPKESDEIVLKEAVNE